jgi:hypothetical protein
MVSNLLASLRRGGLQHLENVLVVKHPNKDKFRFIIKMLDVPSHNVELSLKKYAKTYAKESGWSISVKVTKNCLILEPQQVAEKSRK